MSNEHPGYPLRHNEHWYQDHSGRWLVCVGSPLQDAQATPEMNAAGNIIPATQGHSSASTSNPDDEDSE